MKAFSVVTPENSFNNGHVPRGPSYIFELPEETTGRKSYTHPVPRPPTCRCRTCRGGRLIAWGVNVSGTMKNIRGKSSLFRLVLDQGSMGERIIQFLPQLLLKICAANRADIHFPLRNPKVTKLQTASHKTQPQVRYHESSFLNPPRAPCIRRVEGLRSCPTPAPHFWVRLQDLRDLGLGFTGWRGTKPDPERIREVWGLLPRKRTWKPLQRSQTF